MAERIQQAGMSCRVVDAADYRKAMFEKLIWICAFMLVRFAPLVPRRGAPVVVILLIVMDGVLLLLLC